MCYNKNAFLVAEEGVLVVYFVTPYNYLPPSAGPVVIIVVIMVL
jgi:hypothetical protein